MEDNTDIKFLLSVVHDITLSPEFVEKVIEKWPVNLGVSPPVDGGELGRRIEEIWHKWVGSDLDSETEAGSIDGRVSDAGPGHGYVSVAGPSHVPAPGLVSAPGSDFVSTAVPGPVEVSAHGSGHGSAAGPAKKNSEGTSLINPIIIDDSDEELEELATPVLPRKFRVPPAAGLATPRSISKSVVAVRNTLKDSANSGGNDEPVTPTVTRACSVANDDTAFPSPQSLMRQAMTFKVTNPIKDTKSFKASIKPKSSRAKGKERANDNPEPDADAFKMPFSLTSHRKRRAIDYNSAVGEDQAFDGSDGNYQYEYHDDDERLDQRYEKDYPDLETPSKRQKKDKK